ncbi:MAG: Ig-like domain-containing protein [Bacteroidaceae bacterium]|nr:Ig-like domain-containing protein [Bacteroidaceae bacterium]
MKKKSFFLSLAASVLLTTSCSLDELGGCKGGDVRLISATQTSFGAIEEETRSVVDPTTSPISFKWAEGDHLAIYSGGSASGLTNFDLVDGINSSVATFKPNGFGLMVGSPYYAFSPYDGTQIDKNAIAVNYEGQVQTANAAFAHLGGKDFQYSSATTAVSVSADKMTNFTLAHLGSVCRFQLTVPEDGVYTEFTLSGTGLVSKGKLNITTATFTPEQTGSLTMSLGTGIKVAANSVLILYMMLPPQDLSACPDLTATLCTADKQYVATLTSKNILSGKAYGWSAAVTSSDSDDNVLPGTFSVSATKQVQFTKSNLYWNGSAYKFEANQTDYPTEWNPNHVGHFYWTNLTDYQSGNAAYMPYTEEYSYSSQSETDKFFCGEENPLTVEGANGFFVLNQREWNYLINSRTNASSLFKYGVTVGTKANCLIIAPDDFIGTLKSYYTLDEVGSLGLACLPAAGWRNGSSFAAAETWGLYCLPKPYGSDLTNVVYFGSDVVSRIDHDRYYGCSIRLVRLASSTDEGTEQIPVSSIVLSSSDLSLQVGESATLTATVSPSDASDMSLIWTSSNTSVATVGSNGVVTAVSAGTATITCTAQDGSGVKATCTVTVQEVSNIDNNILPGVFSVSSTKKVQFTKGNLYWDGSDYKFECNQTDYPTEWDAKHVGKFYWASTQDYHSGDASRMPYAKPSTHIQSSHGSTEKFFCDEDHPLTVDGTSGFFPMSSSEWIYLIERRFNASSLYKCGVTVDSKTNCLILAPDNFSGTLKSSYSLEETHSLGLVCLPAIGSSTADYAEKTGYYWCCGVLFDPGISSYNYYGTYFFFNSSNYDSPFGSGSTESRYGLRLVRRAK